MRRRTGRVAASLVVAASLIGTVQPGSGDVPDDEVESWVARYDGSAHSQDVASEVAVSPDGARVFVTGSSVTAGSHYDDIATVAYDARTGDELWSAGYGAAGDDVVSAIAVDPDSARVFITGKLALRDGGVLATVAYDARTGARLWEARYDGPGGDHGSGVAIALSADGSLLFVTGDSEGGTGTDIATLAYDARTGAQAWVARYDGPSGGDDRPAAIALGEDGSEVLVTGQSAGSASEGDAVTISYGLPTGAERWAARYDLPTDEEGTFPSAAIVFGPDGPRVYTVQGLPHVDRSPVTWDYATAAFDARSGQRLWSVLYDGGFSDIATALAVDRGRVFVTGWSHVPTLGAYGTVAYDADSGVQQWAAKYDGVGTGGADWPRDIAVSPDGSRVFVTGVNSAGDYGTLAYDATLGAQLWLAEYSGPALESDGARALAVSPDGSRLFVTGMSTGVGTEEDYATIAYPGRGLLPDVRSGPAISLPSPLGRLWANGREAFVLGARLAYDDGRPAPSVRVRLVAEPADGVAIEPEQAVTDEDGHVRFAARSIAAGTVRLTAIPDIGVSASAGVTFIRRKVVVTVEGLGSSIGCDGSSCAPSSDAFEPLADELSARGFLPSDLLAYSYAGGDVDPATGRWHPSAYGCAESARPYALSVERLVALLVGFGRANPNTDFSVVGFGQGGLLALQSLGYRSDLPQKTRLHGVVSLGGSLGGTPASEASIPAAEACPGSLPGSAPAEQVALYNTADEHDRQGTSAAFLCSLLLRCPDFPTPTTNGVAVAGAENVRVLTIGNTDDAVYDPARCGLPLARNSSSQVVASAEGGLFSWGGNTGAFTDCIRNSHEKVLSVGASIAAAFIGDQLW